MLLAQDGLQCQRRSEPHDSLLSCANTACLPYIQCMARATLVALLLCVLHRPPRQFQPVRECLGWVLLQQGDLQQAEKVGAAHG